MSRILIKSSNIFCGKKELTLWRALPAIEELLKAWEANVTSLHYASIVRQSMMGCRR